MKVTQVDRPNVEPRSDPSNGFPNPMSPMPNSTVVLHTVRPSGPVAVRRPANVSRRVALTAVAAGLAALGALGWLGRDVLLPLLASEAAPLLLGVAASLGAALAGGVLLVLGGRVVARQASGLTQAAELVAKGDLVDAPPSEPGPLGRLWTAVGRTRDMLRGLTVALRRSARDATELAARISAGAEAATRRAEETARTAAAVSHHSAIMARTVDALAADAHRLTAAVGAATEGARDAAAVAELRRLVAQMNERIDSLGAGTHAVASAIGDVSAATEAQRRSSGEIAMSASALVVAGQHLSSLAAKFRVSPDDAVAPPVERPEGGYRPTRLTPFVMPVVAN